MTDAISELWFESYLKDTGHAGWAVHEPDLGEARRPDYFISKGGEDAIVEVKEFTTTDLQRRKQAALRANHPITTSAHKALKPVRNRVRDAADQLRPFRDRGLPLVVVLANPNGVWVDLRPDAVSWALYGDPAVGPANTIN